MQQEFVDCRGDPVEVIGSADREVGGLGEILAQVRSGPRKVINIGFGGRDSTVVQHVNVDPDEAVIRCPSSSSPRAPVAHDLVLCVSSLTARMSPPTTG